VTGLGFRDGAISSADDDMTFVDSLPAFRTLLLAITRRAHRFSERWGSVHGVSWCLRGHDGDPDHIVIRDPARSGTSRLPRVNFLGYNSITGEG
jgi:hypothetical protein